MATISNDPPRVAPDRRSSSQLLVGEMWTSLAISVIWVTVLLDALFGPDIITTSAGGDSSVIPSAIVVAILGVNAAALSQLELLRAFWVMGFTAGLTSIITLLWLPRENTAIDLTVETGLPPQKLASPEAMH